MPTVDIFNLNKEVVGQLELDENVFDGEVKMHLMKAYVEYQLTKKRSGNAHTKTRSEVRGGGKKPWKQKGTGRARAGTNTSPLWRGGGTVFGPRKREYTFKLNKKVKAKAIKSALNYKLNKNLIFVIDNFDISEIKTKNIAGLLSKFNVESAVLMDADNINLKLSSRNLPNAKYLEDAGINVFDLLKHEYLLISKESVEKIEKRLSGN